MSHLDPAIIQPVLQEVLRDWGHNPNNLLQVLIRVQDQWGHVPPAAIHLLARELHLTPAQVEGVVGFYSFLYTTPRQYNILFSDNIIEHFQGKPRLMDYMLRRLKVRRGVPRADGRVCVDDTACIGMSDQGPAILVNGYTVPRLTHSKIDSMVELIEAGIPLREWPESLFQVDDNIQRKHILLGLRFEPGSALRVMMERGVDATMTELAQASIRGCGGAGFKLDSKWMICRNTPADERFVACNADEGEPGTFKDRVLLQSHADLVFEGMTLCARAVGARRGFLYLRGEYRYLEEHLQQVLTRRRKDNLLGENILGDPEFNFDIEIHLGAGAYICGAETAMIESLEGHRGVPRRRPPPFPVTEGYLRKPTVVNNVETLAHAAKALSVGAERFTALGTSQSMGTKLLSISGDCERPGIYEFPFGITVREVLDACGARDTLAVQNSGPAGECIAPSEFSRGMCFEDINTTGSVMIFDKSRDLLSIVSNFARFFVHESCGFCTPCRVGTSLLHNLVEKIRAGRGSGADLKEMASLSHLIKTTSHCGLGMTASNPVANTLRKFPEIYESRLKEATFTPFFDLDSALEESRQLTHRNDAAAHL